MWSTEFNAFVKRCLTLNPKCRPTAKELLLDPLISKSKGPALLSELVVKNIEEIERYRLKQYNYDEDGSDSGSIKAPAKDEGNEIDLGQDGLQTYVNEWDCEKPEGISEW